MRHILGLIMQAVVILHGHVIHRTARTIYKWVASPFIHRIPSYRFRIASEYITINHFIHMAMSRNRIYACSAKLMSLLIHRLGFFLLFRTFLS